MLSGCSGNECNAMFPISPVNTVFMANFPELAPKLRIVHVDLSNN